MKEQPRRVDDYYHDKTDGEVIPEQVLEYVDFYTEQKDKRGRNKFQCVDNIRIFRLGDREGEKQYQIKRGRGCCGFEDFVHYYDYDTKEDYLFGFNHGH